MALTKVNSVGIATGISLTGITTTQDAKIGTGITLSPDGDGYYTGIVTATSYRGDVSNCTGVGQTNFIDAESLNVSGISTFGGAISGTTATFSGNITANGNIVGDDATNISGVNNVIAGTLYTSDSIIHRGETADNTKIRFPADDTVTVETNGSERLRINSTGHMGLGVSPSAWPTNADSTGLQIGTGFAAFGRGSGDEDRGGIAVNYYTDGSSNYYIGNGNANRIYMNDGNIDFQYAGTNSSGAGQALTLTTAARIDTSGRVIVGHNASEGMFYTGRIQVQGTNSSTSAITVKSNQNDSGGPAIVLGKSRSGSVGGNTVVQSGDEFGCIYFNGADGTDTVSQGAFIRGSCDGTPGSNDMPGRLVFGTTADGASTSTERLRIDSAGAVILSNTFNSNSDISPALCIGSSSFSRPGIVIRGNTTNKGDISFCDNSGSDSSEGVSEGLIRYDHNGDYMCFHAADEERARITSTGQLCIGSTANYGTIGYESTLQVRKDVAGGNASIQIVNGASSNASSTCDINCWQDYRLATRIISGRENADNWTSSAASGASFLAFYTNSAGTVAEKMRITSSGKVNIGNTTNTTYPFAVKTTAVTQVAKFESTVGTNEGAEFQIYKNSASPANNDQLSYLQFSGNDSAGNGLIYGAIIQYSQDVTDGAEDGGMFFYNRNSGGFSQVLKINHDGTFTGSGSNDISDQRLKENITTVTNATAKIKALKGRTFNWKSEAKLQTGTQYGFIAQEVESVLPELVDDKNGIRQFDKDGNLVPQDDKGLENNDEGTNYAKSVHVSGVVPVLVEALKEALVKIETLETKVAALESA